MKFSNSKIGLALLTTFSILLFNCSGFKKSSIWVERFEFLDEYSGNDYKDERLNNRLLYKAYVIHGYKKEYDKEINHYIDNYLCDSLMPNLDFVHIIYIPFYKASKNTNRENFQVRPKNKNIYARSNDLLFHYRLFHANDSAIWIAKQKAGLSELDPPEEKFECK